MNEDIRRLIESLRRGDYDNPQSRIDSLAAALREEGGADVELLLSLLAAPQVSLRLAALDACRHRNHPKLWTALATLARDSETRVREKLAQNLNPLPDRFFCDTIRTLAADTEPEVRAAAVKASTGEPSLRELQRTLLSDDPSYDVRLAAVEGLSAQRQPSVVVELFRALTTDDDDDVQRRCAEHVEKKLATLRTAVETHLPTDIAVLDAAEKVIRGLGGQRFPHLLKYIHARTTVEVNPAELAQYGVDLTALAMQGALPRAFEVRELCRSVMDILLRNPARSVVLLGEAGCGKTAVVNELVYELMQPQNGAWRVLRVIPSEFLTGTKYIGEWETRLKSLIEAARRPRRVIVYIPNIEDLSGVGRHEKSDHNVAATLAPYIEDGSMVVLGESTPAQYDRGLGGIQSMQRLFERVVLQEATIEQTRTILSSLRDHLGSPISDGVLEQLMDLSGQYLSHVCRPGNAIGLLRTVFMIQQQTGQAVTLRQILNALSTATGIPADLLDDAVPLDLTAVRNFFEARVMGQPEAVDAVVDLVTLIKSGLTDPYKPFAVLLFVGPTGVGKTELARALAEFIFGDAKRLQRFDMSEFASQDGFERLIGAGGHKGLLTQAVREYPFSVVLLDEIEKSHLNVFDLCLQLFDAGRLTDGRGRTVDFRRTIVILTSNVGASAPGGPPLGFNPVAPAALPETDKDRTFRELSRFFRPEFLNRIDRIINFRPLSLEVAESIARKEINQVLQRTGISRRQLTVDIEPSVLSLLVREGYSPHFGARPLKRAVERLVLLPLGRMIAGGKIEPRTIVHLAEREGKLAVRISHPPSAATAESPPSPQELSLAQQWQQTHEAYLRLEEQVQPLADRKSELLLRTQQTDFYKQEATRVETFDEIHKLDQFLTLQRNLGTALDNFRHRLETQTAPAPDRGPLQERLDQLAAEVEQLGSIASSRNAADLGDALLCFALVDRSGDSLAAIEKLSQMYLAFAERRRLTVEILAEQYDAKNDLAYLQISGLGAFGLLKIETGLHQFDRRYRVRLPRAGREKQREDREVIRIQVLPASSEPGSHFDKEIKAKVQPLRPARSRLLEKADLDIQLFHEPSLRSLHGWTVGPRPQALQRMQKLLYQTQGMTTEADAARVVRHYDLGIAPRIKDLRTGRSTNRIDRVFKGHLELLLR